MKLQKNTNIIKHKKLYHNKELQIFSFVSSNYSNCHPTYGDFNDKENIN